MSTPIQSVSQMIADIGRPTDGELNASNCPPHPASLSGPLVDWCQKTAKEQLWEVEERRFEKRLRSEVQERHAKGWSEERLEFFARHHREKWRSQRLTSAPQKVREREDAYMQATADLDPPPHWQD